MDALPADTPTTRLGKRTMAYEKRSWKGKDQIGFTEVTPQVDGMTVTGWFPVFKGIRIQGSKEELMAFAGFIKHTLGK